MSGKPDLKPEPRVKNYVRGEKHPFWKGDATSDKVKRRRVANRPIPDGTSCERCKTAAAVDRHHKDSDPGNNDPGNIAFLCRRCHQAVDGRMELLRAFGSRPRVPTPPKPCNECGKLYKPLCHGRCHACDMRWRRRRAREAAA